MINLKIQRISDLVGLPYKATTGSAGFDLQTAEKFTIFPNEIKKIDTGIRMEIPQGYFVLVRPRSGLASKHGIVLCTSGVIDEDYRGPFLVPLINLGQQAIKFGVGDRIAQFLVLPVPDIKIEEVNELSETTRGTGGYGSTGR